MGNSNDRPGVRCIVCGAHCAESFNSNDRAANRPIKRSFFQRKGTGDDGSAALNGRFRCVSCGKGATCSFVHDQQRLTGDTFPHRFRIWRTQERGCGILASHVARREVGPFGIISVQLKQL